MEKTEIIKGDIYYADLGTTIGSEQSGTRPVIVVQNNIGNKYSPTTIVVPLTTMNKNQQPTHYILDPSCNIPYYSVVLAEQIRVIDKKRLKNKIGFLNKNIMKEIDNTIKIALELKGYKNEK